MSSGVSLPGIKGIIHIGINKTGLDPCKTIIKLKIKLALPAFVAGLLQRSSNMHFYLSVAFFPFSLTGLSVITVLLNQFGYFILSRILLSTGFFLFFYLYHKLKGMSDRGAKVSDNEQHNIFEPFYTTKKIVEGTGPGLSVSNNIIQQHNGTISVKSEPGKDTAFTIILPINQEHSKMIGCYEKTN